MLKEKPSSPPDCHETDTAVVRFRELARRVRRGRSNAASASPIAASGYFMYLSNAMAFPRG